MPNYDCYGFCSLCHCSLLTKDKDLKGKPIVRLSGKSEHMEVALNDGSKMRVLLCRTCKDNYTHEDYSEKLMKSVIDGWEKECDQLVSDESKPKFDEKWKENYMEVYRKKEILNAPSN